ncbi:MAG: hypothetical protein ACU88J_02920 [Gammaproteobacteria bacterium]
MLKRLDHYHHQHITQPLLLKQLQDLGVELSSGRLSQFITDGLDVFHDEKDLFLPTGFLFDSGCGYLRVMRSYN